MSNDLFSPIEWQAGALALIDQRQLPTDEHWVRCTRWTEVAEAIRTMVVRGAPAIGVTAAYGMAIAAAENPQDAALETARAGLAATRPTAVNLFWALDRAQAVVRAQPPEARAAALLAEARRIHAEDVAMCQAMGAHGAALLPDGARVLTHCNTGALATGGWGTALGVIRSAWRDGRLERVYADETRPFLQGARLTAWELHRDAIPVTVITDNMAAWLMAQGRVDAILVGTDRIAANGDVANKIGTYGLAVLAAAHEIPFYVVGPTSTVDLRAPDEAAIPIERRPDIEVTHVGPTRLVPEGVSVENPAFDVTPARYVTAIITEHGAIRAPFERGLAAHVAQSTDRSVDTGDSLA